MANKVLYDVSIDTDTMRDHAYYNDMEGWEVEHAIDLASHEFKGMTNFEEWFKESGYEGQLLDVIGDAICLYIETYGYGLHQAS